MRESQLQGFRAVAVAVFAAASCVASAGSAAAAGTSPSADTVVNQQTPMPALVPTTGEAGDVPVEFGVAGPTFWSGTLTVLAPSGTAFAEPPSPNGLTGPCAVQTPTEFVCHVSWAGGASARIRLKATDPAATASGGSATFAPDPMFDALTVTIPLAVAFGDPFSVPMISPEVGAAALPVAGLGGLVLLRRRRAAC
jgi:MYXO-CTERM domain-containing protein